MSQSKSAKLGFYTYTINFKRLSDENHGETDTNTKEMWINTRFSDEIQRETLFHELLHVSLEDCPSLRIEEMKAGDREEDIVRCISPRMVQYLADNDWLREFIFGK
jgi:Zn-dependent peptidase ImmA (M78 family)